MRTFDERPVTHPAPKQILGILDEGEYSSPSGSRVSIADAQQAAETGCSLYSPDALEVLRGSQTRDVTPAIEVADATTQEAAFDSTTE